MVYGFLAKKYPSIVLPKRNKPNLEDALNKESALRALRCDSEFALIVFANSIPVFSPSASGAAGKAPSMEPLSPIAPANNFFDKDEAINALTDTEPADSPAMVTLVGSPPKAAIFCCTQRKAATWSNKP